MARKKVTHYAVFHNIGGTSTVIMKYDSGAADQVQNLSIEESSYIVDLLRNEKPMSYDHNLGRLSTLNYEPVGENE